MAVWPASSYCRVVLAASSWLPAALYRSPASTSACFTAWSSFGSRFITWPPSRSYHRWPSARASASRCACRSRLDRRHHTAAPIPPTTNTTRSTPVTGSILRRYPGEAGATAAPAWCGRASPDGSDVGEEPALHRRHPVDQPEERTPGEPGHRAVRGGLLRRGQRPAYGVETVVAQLVLVLPDRRQQGQVAAVRRDQVVAQECRVAQRGVGADPLERGHAVDRVAEQRDRAGRPRVYRGRGVDRQDGDRGRVGLGDQAAQVRVPAVDHAQR